VAQSDVKVLITGESGVGKELVAKRLHRRGRRAANVFAAVNCAGLPETLLESELFGHARGSFTGAYRDKRGILEIAHSGTLFLDEVGEMSPRMQALLLRFLETGEIQRVGADVPTRHVNVRVVAATNRDLPQMVTEGAFREDLFYRLNVIHITVPPLRDRRDDITCLIGQFLTEMAIRHDSRSLTVTPVAMKALMEYPWPGNIRELQNAIERLVVITPGPTIELDHLPTEIRDHATFTPPRGERRRSVAHDLFHRMVDEKQSFLGIVHPLLMDRDLTRADVREIVRLGLKEARGSYRRLTCLFNMEPREYKRFMSFLRQYDCHVPFKDYRTNPVPRVASETQEQHTM
jgi:two-component system response regulator AtoC